jgi:hypothetical protein
MNIKILLVDSYLAAIKNSLGSKIFNNLWAEVDGVKQDILGDGRKSCGYFTSGILLWFGLIKERHATVSGTLKDMKNFGWEEISEPKIGSVLHWDKELGNGEFNEHIGFYMGENLAISTSAKEHMPVEHHWTYGEELGLPKRKVIAIYWHPRLNN